MRQRFPFPVVDNEKTRHLSQSRFLGLLKKIQRCDPEGQIQDSWGFVTYILLIPPILLWSLITKPFVAHNTAKAWKRVIMNASMQKPLSRLTPAHMQWASGDCFG
ncbi:hypothetical protein BDN72DRAFT_625201 [Pluteus cervinus]|uniref:Uncharacterized protein n=1 Tax=Pluteus cervinus TaxID=181527 RepID=A0ACD3AUA1_9AGAR|nr:hypothetical protein BDN72DRAFT_625201 [Pluteus cervinus]